MENFRPVEREGMTSVTCKRGRTKGGEGDGEGRGDEEGVGRVVQGREGRSTTREIVLTTIDLDVDVLNLEHRRLIVRVLVREDHRRTNAETFTADEDVGETRVLHLGQTRLLAVVERNVAHVSLDLGQRERNLVVLVVCSVIRIATDNKEWGTYL